jgi:DNA-binding HxlR family transcriptional regulator
MTHLQHTILTRLTKGPAIPPQLWLSAPQGEKELMLETLHALVRSGHVLREDRGRTLNWYFYSLTDKGAQLIKGVDNED